MEGSQFRMPTLVSLCKRGLRQAKTLPIWPVILLEGAAPPSAIMM